MIRRRVLVLYYFYIFIYIFTFVSAVNNTKPSTSYKLSLNRQMTAQNKVPVEPIYNGLYLKDLASAIGTTLRDISNRELRVPVMQDMYDSFDFVPINKDEHKNLLKITNRINSKLNETLNILNSSNELIESYHETMLNENDLLSTVFPCPHTPSTYVWDTFKKLNDDKNNTDSSNFITYLPSAFNLSQVFSEHLSRASNCGIDIKQIYFLSSMDTKSNVPLQKAQCLSYDNTRMWREYLIRETTESRTVVIIIDHGNSLSNQQFFLAKAVAKSMVEMLKDEDSVGIIALSDSYSTAYLVDQCTSVYSNDSTLLPASDFNKGRLITFINSLVKSEGITNHSLGFDIAFETIGKFAKTTTYDISNVLLVYISRGLLSSLAEAKTVLQTIATESQKASVPVIINTVPVIDDTKPLMYEKHFLTDVASLNFSKYDINHDLSTDSFLRRGILQVVNSTFNLGLVSIRFYATLWDKKQSFDKEVKISLPACDPVNKDITMTLSVAVGNNENLGVLAMDLYLNDITEDISYSSHPRQSYIFIINMKGETIIHKFLPRWNACRERTEPIDIKLLEKVAGFEILYKRLLKEKNGSSEITGDKNETITYRWQRVLNFFVVCVVTNEQKSVVRWLQRVSLPRDVDLLHHHRLDLIPPPSVCRHLKQIVTQDSGALYLSASCFESPFHHKWDADMSPLTLESYIAYMKDDTGLLANPGFKPDVRNEVLSLLHMMPYLKRQHLEGALRQYAVRRYMASAGGVLEVFPGTLIEHDLNPVHRPWYQQAMEHPGRVILTPPYLDLGGAGYIITLSHTIYEGRGASVHTSKDSVVAVMGIDLTLGYIYKLLIEKMPFCKHKNLTCFLMDDKGYLISHPSLIDPNGKGPVEQTHIVHKESLLAIDLLYHKYFVKKNLCNNYADNTMQRYYQFNLSYTGTLTNVVHREHCSKYQMNGIAGTNLFIGVVNSTCKVSATFCPCSTVDRLCMNCNRMEQNECECPCECPLNIHKLRCDSLNASIIRNPTCSVLPEQAVPTSTVFYAKKDVVKDCAEFHCELYTSHDSCLGILGCEWCQIDMDGETPLGTPFCTSQSACFNGILGAVTPYGDGPLGIITSNPLVPSYSPVGPAIGSIILLCLILMLLSYFYRQNIASSSEQLYPDSGPEHTQPSVRGNQLEMDNINEERDGQRDMLMSYNLEPVSPYRVSTSYRRPHTTGDSDHGYSTMTPHEESEHLSIALVEPLLTLKDDEVISDITSDRSSMLNKRSPRTADATSSSGKQSSESLNDNLEITMIPNTHFLLAPVIVHRNMEAI